MSERDNDSRRPISQKPEPCPDCGRRHEHWQTCAVRGVPQLQFGRTVGERLSAGFALLRMAGN